MRTSSNRVEAFFAAHKFLTTLALIFLFVFAPLFVAWVPSFLQTNIGGIVYIVAIILVLALAWIKGQRWVWSVLKGFVTAVVLYLSFVFLFLLYNKAMVSPLDAQFMYEPSFMILALLLLTCISQLAAVESGRDSEGE